MSTIATQPSSPPSGTAATRLTVGASLGYFLVLVDSTILNVALPDISHSLGGSVSGQQWTISGYLIAFGALLLGSGTLGDVFGSLRVYRVGVLAFGVTSLLCALAPNLALLIAFRILQGAAAALIPGTTLAIMARINPNPAARNRALGLYALVTGVGFAAGPVLGGGLVAAGGWRWTFVVNVPLAVAALLWARKFPADPPRRRGARLDVVAQLLTVLFLALLVLEIISWGDGSPVALWALGPAVLALALVVWWERRSAAPAIPLPLLRNGLIARSVLWGGVIQVAFATTLFVMGLYLIDRRGLTAWQTGLMMVGFTFAPAVLGPAVARLATRWGRPRMLRLGLGITTIGAAGLAVSVSYNAPLAVLVVAMIFGGVGLPTTILPLTAYAMTGAPAGQGATAGALFSAARQIGGALGVAALGALIGISQSSAGTALAFVGVAAVTAAGLLAESLWRYPTGSADGD